LARLSARSSLVPGEMKQMNIVKSLHAGILHRTFNYRGKTWFTVSALWGFRLDTGEPVLEQKLWESIATALGKDSLFDAGMPKVQGEALVHGSFCSPTGRPVGVGRVSVSLGSIHKQLAVFGDRRWVEKLGAAVAVTDPDPMTEMPVSYTNAFGGEGFKKNPIGKGTAGIETEHGTVRPLPNIEYPDSLIGSPNDRPDPAGFDRLDLLWIQRSAKAGTYDEKYLRKRMPGLPDDIDWSYFNDAPPDQWVDGFFQGDENFEIVHMNPDMPVLRGRLPGVYGRCFVNHEIEGTVSFKEIGTKLDTVWLFPYENLGVLIYRGSFEVFANDGLDVKQVLIAHEHLGDRPRAKDHYCSELEKRIDPQEAALHMMNTAPLIPEGCTCGIRTIMQEANYPFENLAVQNLNRYGEKKKQDAEAAVKEETTALQAQEGEGSEIAAALARAGAEGTEQSPEARKIKELMDTIAPGAGDDPEGFDIAKVNLKGIDDLKAYVEQRAAERKQEADEQLKKEMEQLKSTASGLGDHAAVQAIERMLADLDLPPVLPRFNSDKTSKVFHDQIAQLQQEVMVMQSMGLPKEQLAEFNPDFEDMEQQIKDGIAKAREGYRIGAHYIEEARSPHPGKEPEIARELVEAYSQGQSAAGGDYAFVDLSGRNLSGIDLSGAYLEYADLSGADLSGADLTNAVLAHADLSGADLSGAGLSGANLGAALLKETKFVDADLTGAVLGRSLLSGTTFIRCKLVDRMEMFLEAQFERAKFIESDLHSNNFIDAHMAGCSLEGSDLSGSNFINPVLKEAVFDRAKLNGVNFVKAQAKKARFADAEMQNVRFVGGCCLAGAMAAGAQAGESNFMDCDLSNADFSGALIAKSNFGNANLTGVIFTQTGAAQAQFGNANLTGAVLIRAHLMEVSFYYAVLSGANFRGANLYAATFIGSTLGKTDFSGADLEQTILKDWRPPA